jgi:hypothetical protein
MTIVYNFLFRALFIISLVLYTHAVADRDRFWSIVGICLMGIWVAWLEIMVLNN